MADQLGVKLQQVYLIPSGKGQMANAFASSGNNISFTDFLLQRMSQREVDYVMAHELTHLKLQHPSKLAMARVGGHLLGGVLLTAVALVLPSANFTVIRYLLMLAAMTTFPYFISRRFEYAADAGAVAATSDPRSAISALFKLSQLNMLPLHWNKWSEKWLFHPSSLRRAQAIARKAGIPVEQIPAIAQEGSRPDTSTYASQTIAAASNKVHSTQHKKASIQKLSYMLVATISFVPSLFALAAQDLHGDRAVQLLLLALSIPAAFAAVLVSNYIPRLTRGNISARLDQKLTAQGIQVASWGGIYVGFAPAAAPRIYEATSFWDVGYLFLRSDRLCYWGEEAQFALRRDQITDIKLDVGLPGYLGAKRVCIAWRDDLQGACGVFNLGRGQSDSVRSGSRQSNDLAGRLQAWWKTPSPVRALPAPLDTLSTPAVRAVTSAVPGALWKPRKLFFELVATAWIAGLAAMLCHLPFHLADYLNASSYSRLGLPALPSPGAGWFVVLVATLVRFLSLVPALRYRDKPILVAQSPTKTPAAVPPTSTPSPSGPIPRDPVTVA
jgi:Zn-dependent protease with chaperone function